LELTQRLKHSYKGKLWNSYVDQRRVQFRSDHNSVHNTRHDCLQLGYCSRESYKQNFRCAYTVIEDWAQFPPRLRKREWVRLQTRIQSNLTQNNFWLKTLTIILWIPENACKIFCVIRATCIPTTYRANLFLSFVRANLHSGGGDF
jgi:hypothetical protein